MTNPDSRLPAYLQLAAYFRDRITAGQLKPGDRLLTEQQIQQTTGRSRNTIRAGMRVLQDEGLIIIRPPYGSFVREGREPWELSLYPGDRAELRQATPAEQQEHVVSRTALMLQVTRRDGRREHCPADCARIVVLDDNA